MYRKKEIKDFTKMSNQAKEPEFVRFGEPQDPDGEDYEVYKYKGIEILFNYNGEYEWSIYYNNQERWFKTLNAAAKYIDRELSKFEKKYQSR